MTLQSNILLVEDNPDDAELIEYAFKKAGVTAPLIRINDGDAAVAYLRCSGDQWNRLETLLPALVLLDLKLPKRSGFKVLSFIRGQAATKHVPVVVLTSSNQPSDIDRSYDLGANSYLVKPVRHEDLTKMVDALNKYWIGLNQSSYPH